MYSDRGREGWRRAGHAARPGLRLRYGFAVLHRGSRAVGWRVANSAALLPTAQARAARMLRCRPVPADRRGAGLRGS